MIISFSGYKGSGKDLACDTIIKNHKNSIKLSFADPLKKMTHNVYQKLFNEKIDIKEFYTYQGKEKNRHGTSLRKLLQVIGTDIVREVDETYWLKIMEKNIQKLINQYDYILIPDTRFSNEIEMLKKYESQIVYIDRFEKSKDLHISESSIEKLNYDKVINNKGSKEEFIDTIKTEFL